MKKIVFLHHSTGNNVWLGNTNPYFYKLTRKGDVQKYFDDHNRKNNSEYKITDLFFPKSAPYGWNNYPHDYYNIWVKNAGENYYMEEPTLEILTKEYDVIIFKHCYPGSNIEPDNGSADIDSDKRTLANYKLQYNALKDKMHQFPDKKFIVWSPAVNLESMMTEDEAKRTYQFYKWMTEEWDENNDNVFIWDFYKLETEDGLFLPLKNAMNSNDSHPGKDFSAMAAPLFSQYIIDVIETIPE